MTPYEILSNRLANHVYKKGQFKGDAPLEARKKSYVRVRRLDDTTVAVRMYHTDILTAHNNGNIVIALDNWHTSTTKMWLNYALTMTCTGLRITSKSVQSLNQLTMRTPYGYYLYYNGMEFDSHGRLLSKPLPFEARRINKLETAEFMQSMEDSGFKDMYPVLYATADPEDINKHHRPIETLFTDPDQARDWSIAIANHKYERKWDWSKSQGVVNYQGYIVERDNAKACWSRMMKQAKSNMYDTIRTEVTVIPVSKP